MVHLGRWALTPFHFRLNPCVASFQVLDSSDIDQSDADSSLTPAQKKKKKLELVGKKRAAERKAKAQQAYADDSDDSDDLDGSAATARRKKAALAAIAKGSAGPPQIGSRLNCGECDKQFTYVRRGLFAAHALLRAAVPVLTHSVRPRFIV